ncbi:MAG: L,D-transpeptidase [Fusobacteriaceae bacterium]|nr:L,D-transpeptidase [Fusobacteriaceae bacterium]
MEIVLRNLRYKLRGFLLFLIIFTLLFNISYTKSAEANKKISDSQIFRNLIESLESKKAKNTSGKKESSIDKTEKVKKTEQRPSIISKASEDKKIETGKEIAKKDNTKEKNVKEENIKIENKVILNERIEKIEKSTLASAKTSKPVVENKKNTDKKIIAKEKVSPLIEINNIYDWMVLKIVYELPNGKNKILSWSTIKEWIKKNDEGKYYFSEKELLSYIKIYVFELAGEIDTKGLGRTFNSTLQGEIIINGGSYGWKINQKAEIEQLKKDILITKSIYREPSYSSRELTKENSGIGNTYVEVDLTNQRVYYYVNGELFLDAPCVSGAISLGRKTPGGIYTLYHKERNRVLRGRKKEDGTYEYESPVKYWMPFNGGIGLHDANWRSRFGGKIYVNAGSHGCINLPPKKAEEIYKVIEKDTPVVVFY